MFAAPIAHAIQYYGVDVPFWDQWEYVRFFIAAERGTLSLSDLFELHNEYRQLVPNAIFLGLGIITKWRVQCEMMLTLLVVASIAWMLFGYLRPRETMPLWVQVTLSVFICTFLCTPAQFENWLFGVQLVYFVGIFCLLLCLNIAMKPWRSVNPWLLILPIASLSTLSTVNGFLCWMAVLPLLLQKKMPVGRGGLLFAGGGIALFTGCVALYVHHYAQPGNLPTLFQKAQSVPMVAQFFVRLIGTGLGSTTYCGSETAWILDVHGALITLCWTAFAVLIWCYRGHGQVVSRYVPWLVIGGYGLATAMMVTFGRSNLGLAQACASRYIGYTVFLGLSTFVIPIIWYYSDGKRSKYRPLALIMVAWMLVLTATKWRSYTGEYLQLQHYGAYIARAKSGLLVSRFLPLSGQQALIYPSGFDELLKKATWLDAHGYLRPRLKTSPFLQPADIQVGDSPGAFTQVTHADAQILAEGTLDNANAMPIRHAVVATARNAQGQRRMVGIDNSGLTEWRMHIPKDRLDTSDVLLECWQLDNRTGLFLNIRGTHALEH